MIRSLLGGLRGSSDPGNSEVDDEEPSETSGEDDPDATDVNAVWEFIPFWEYGGKYVSSGGHSRDEQERALADIQRQAAEIERADEDYEDLRDS